MLRDASRLAEHQRTALARLAVILDRCGGAILADEPGLGKSFVAAALAAGEQRRGRAIELIVPASLIDQWRHTLREFGVDCSVISHDALIRDFSLPEARERLIIVDEAHSFRNPKTQRYAALARRSVGARVLLVTATPVCNSARDLEALIRLFAADDAPRDFQVPSIDLAFQDGSAVVVAGVVTQLVVRRSRTVLPAALQFGDLDRRVIRFDPVPEPQAAPAGDEASPEPSGSDTLPASKTPEGDAVS